MGKKELLPALLDRKRIAILKTLLQSTEELYLNEIAKKSQVSVASTFRLLKEFAALGLVERKVWKNNKVYFCQNNEKTALLKDLLLEEFDGVKAFLEAVQGITGIHKIIQHGKAGQNKATIILIGEALDQEQIKQACSKIKENGFNLSFIILAPEQYNQMVEMGLYSGDKTILK